MINYYLHTLLLLTTYYLLGALALPEQDGLRLLTTYYLLTANN